MASAPVRDYLMAEIDGQADKAIVNGDYATVAGADAVPQGIKIRCRLFLGENWLNSAKGMDWFGSVLIKNPRDVVVRQLLREQIADTPDVSRATAASLLLDHTTRQGSISASAITTYSTPASIAVGFGAP